MKLNTLHILLLMLAGCFAACTDDISVPITDDGNDTVYTLQLSIDDVPQSRGVNTVTLGGLKTYWCYGDVVTLSDGTNNYNFTVATPTGKQKGERVGDEGSGTIAVFTYSGAKIPNWGSFTGSLTYKAEGYDSRNESKYICHTAASNTTSGKEEDEKFRIDCYEYALQTANDNTDHLKCIESLSASFEKRNLNSTNAISMRRNCSVLKIVLDDIYYDIYGGSVLFVKGLKPVNTSTADDVLAMVLGEGIVSETQTTGKYLYSTIKQNYAQNPKEDLNIEPFFKVSPEKQPYTGYGERDDDHKLVVYIPIFEEYELADEKISIYLRDSWAMDWYVWETAPLKKFKLKLGSVYTIDFTKKVAGNYVYESTAAICLGNSNFYGLFGCKNIGAEKPTDVGNYYMLGNKNPIICGKPYPNPQGHETPYFFYENNGTKDYLKYNNPGGSIGLSLEFIKPESYGSGNTNLTRVKILSEMDLADLWVEYLPQLDNDFPSFIGTWTLPKNASENYFKNMTTTLLPTVVAEDGTDVPANTVCENPAGVSCAVPIRPALWEVNLGNLFKYIPGRTGNK